MAQYYPVVVQAGNNLAGDSLGFHAYSLRVDNCTNQWYLEETSLAYIPPYSLGVCLRLYGTGVAILLNSAPIGQPQLAPITGEQIVGVYSDQLRTEVAPSPIRQFTLVQSVSDLTQGAQPATPPVGITRLWAAPNGDLHYLLSSGVDATLLSSTNYAAYVGGSPLGADLYGTVSAGHVGIRNSSSIFAYDSGGTLRTVHSFGTEQLFWDAMNGGFRWVNQVNNAEWMRLESAGNLTIQGTLAVVSNANITGSLATGQGINSGQSVNAGGGVYYFSSNLGVYWQWDGSHIMTPNAVLSSSYIVAQTSLSANAGYVYFNSGNSAYWYWNGTAMTCPNPLSVSNTIQTTAGPIYMVNTTTYLNSDGTNVLIFATGGAIFTRASAIYCQTAAAAYAPVYASAFSVQSSQRFKEAIEPLDPKECLAQVLDTRSDPVIFTVIDSQLRDIGFIAEDLAHVVPQVVDYDSDHMIQGAHYGALTATLWAAMRALDARLSALETAA